MKKLRYILDRNCLWLDLVDNNTKDVHVSTNVLITAPVEMPFLILRVKRKRAGYWKNRLIKISERQLDEAVKRMVEDPKFKSRYDDGNLTVPDVETMIKIATYGTLTLDLFEY